nr:integrase, catalytic region, zinc finger, CCHC-type, peptidase aspartic, catalytic [Tanacetum cinerariifolium]
MSTQQDIYTGGSKSRPHMLNKENYVPWSSRLLRYAKSRPNGKLIHNSILNGPYVRKMIPEPGDANREITVTETFHLQSDDELSDKELKQIEADDQAIQTILLGLPADIYAAKSSYDHSGVDMLLLFIRPRICTQQITLNYQSSFNQNYLQQPMPNPEDITDPITAMNMALKLMAKAFKLNYSTPTNNNQRISLNPRNRQIAQSGMNMGQDRQMQMVGGNGGNQFRQYAWQNAGNPAGYNDVIGNQIGNGNLVAARAEGNAAGQNENQIRCYNCRGVADLDKIKEVNANCILMANLQQALTSGTQTDSAPVYDTDGSAEVHENCDDNEIFNMFTQEEQYTELLEPIPESHQVPQNDNDVISEDTSVEQGGETIEQHPVNFEETRVLYESLYQNLATYNDMQQKVERLQAQLRDLKGKSSNTPSASNTLDPLNQKLESKIVEIEFQVVNYECEISHLKTTYKNLFDSIKSNRAHAKLHDLIFENAKLRARLFKNTFVSVKNISGTSVTPHVDKPKLNVVTPLSKKLHVSMSSHSVPQPREFNVVKHRNVIAPGMFKINLSQTPRENVGSNTVTASSTGLVHTAKTRRPQPKGNTRNARVPSASKSSEVKKIVTVEDHRRTLLLSKNQKTMSSECNNIKLAIQNDKSKIVYDTSKNDLISGLPKFKYAKEHLCPSCEKGKSKRASHPPKPVLNSKQRLHLLYMDLCGPMRVASINGKRYVQVILDDYSRYTWVHFLRTKDETPEENEYAKLWNDWYKECKQCKYDKISYDKAYNDMQQKIERLQAQLGDLKGKSNTSCKSDTLKPFPQKLENENLELEFQVIQICLWCVNSGCSKHMTGNLKLLINFIWKFMGTVRFGNDHVAAILGFGDLEGLGHNLFSVGQFCDSNLEVAFRRNACFVRNLEGVDLLKGDRSINLYTINLQEMASASPIRLMLVLRLLSLGYGINVYPTSTSTP